MTDALSVRRPHHRKEARMVQSLLHEGDRAHKDVMRSIELLGKEVIPALHAIKLHPYE
jgi:hypothetical protein